MFDILSSVRVLDEQIGKLQNVLTVSTQKLPPIHVDHLHPYLTTMVPFNPSPDWFSGFYAFNTIDGRTSTFFKSFTINVYPWDGGTRNGATYTSPGSAVIPAKGISEITVQTVPASKVFLNPQRTGILPVATWVCNLSVL